MDQTPVAQSTNEQLRQLVERAGLTQAVALTIFNRGLGPAAYTFDTWRGFFVKPESSRFRPLKPELLEHAQKTIGQLKK